MRALLLAAAIATAQTPTLPDARTEFPVVDAYGSRVVWSDYDGAIGAWRLAERSGGTIRGVPVAPRSSPFDVDLGPDGHGGTLAVYSRRGRLFAYSFRTGREHALGVRGRWPTVWSSRIAFVHGARPYWRRRTGSGAAHRLPVPRVKGRATVAELDMRGRAVVYTWRAVGRFDTYSFIVRATTGGSLRLLSRGAWFAGGGADALKSVSQPALGARGVDWLYRDVGHADQRAAFLRRRGARVQASAQSTAVAFAHTGATAYWIDAGPRGESQPGGAFPLMRDRAVAYGAARRSYLQIPRCGLGRPCRPL
jgi:hypothetical protein